MPRENGYAENLGLPVMAPRPREEASVAAANEAALRTKERRVNLRPPGN
jgi:hypothetical protein